MTITKGKFTSIKIYPGNGYCVEIKIESIKITYLKCFDLFIAFDSINWLILSVESEELINIIKFLSN